MYSIDWQFLLSKNHRGGKACADRESTCAALAQEQRRRVPIVSSTVWALGITSFFTDISSEMVASILPVYLVLHLGMSPLAFGFVDGLYQGAAALVRIAAGVLSDRWRRHKEIAALGYGLSAACRLLILAAGAAWSTIAYVIAIDRIGKGIRTAPRDAMIAASTPRHNLATAFGVHRSLDAAGAMIGPILAFALLAMIPGGYDVLFIASFAVAVIGVAAIMLFVTPAARAADKRDPAPQLSRTSTARLLADPSFRGIVIAATVLGVATISDSFIFLMLQKRMDLAATAFPLLYVATSLFTSLFAVPFGRLADRVGRQTVLFSGYGLLALVYVALLAPDAGGLAVLALAIALLGGYYAATEGVLTAMAAAALPSQQSGSGLAVLATATNLSRFSASILFGWLWMKLGVSGATMVGLTGLAAAIVCAALVLRRAPHVIRPDDPGPAGQTA
jgi:MFS family permease